MPISSFKRFARWTTCAGEESPLPIPRMALDQSRGIPNAGGASQDGALRPIIDAEDDLSHSRLLTNGVGAAAGNLSQQVMSPKLDDRRGDHSQSGLVGVDGIVDNTQYYHYGEREDFFEGGAMEQYQRFKI